MYKIGIIGDRESVQGFGAIGIITAMVDFRDYDECRAAFAKYQSENYVVIFVTEPVAVTLSKEIDKISHEPIPAVIILPNNTGSSGVGMENIKKSVERAVGADILT